MVTEKLDKDFNSIKPRLLKSLNDTLFRDCQPPPDKLIIPHYSVQPADEPGWAYAKVIYVVYCPTEKVHSVDITFRYDRHCKFLLDTMQYV
jgi:hypothetical protein